MMKYDADSIVFESIDVYNNGKNGRWGKVVLVFAFKFTVNKRFTTDSTVSGRVWSEILPILFYPFLPGYMGWENANLYRDPNGVFT